MAHRESGLAELSRELTGLAGRLHLLLNEPALASLRPTPQLVRLVLGMRMMAAEHFVPDLGEPARKMLLSLYAAELEGKVLTPTRLAAASAVPLTTALRWLEIMGERGLVQRSADGRDRRLVRLALSQEANAGIEAYLAAIFEEPFLLRGLGPNIQY